MFVAGQNVGELILQYLELTAGISEEEKRLPWFKIEEVFFLSLEANRVTYKFPILRQSPKKSEELPWHYQGRDWYYWLNLFASAYGWNKNDVAELDIDDALGLFQEIELDRQFEKEWEHGLSPLSYPYDKASKKTKFIPLKRPSWMNKLPEISKISRKIPKKMMPVGIILKVGIDENQNANDS